MRELPLLAQAESSGGGVALGQQQSVHPQPVGAAVKFHPLAGQWTYDPGDVPSQLGAIEVAGI